jgi:hypothetical protein
MRRVLLVPLQLTCNGGSGSASRAKLQSLNLASYLK